MMYNQTKAVVSIGCWTCFTQQHSLSANVLACVLLSTLLNAISAQIDYALNSMFDQTNEPAAQGSTSV